jgi:hypothetical protein
MAPGEPSLRHQLSEARGNVRQQIDRLQARYYPFAPIGFVRGGLFPLFLFLLGMGSVAPFRTNGVFLDNSGLITRLTRTYDDIDDALEGLGAED